MPARDLTRWTQNDDGTWRVKSRTDVEALASSNGAYDEMTKAELEEELASRDLPKYGNKDELIARLEENDAA